MVALQPYHFYIAATLGALAVSLFSIPNIIFVTKKKRLFDVPDNHRKLHKRIVPNLGGVGIFFAFIITTSLFIKPAQLGQSATFLYQWNYIAAASLILFITGLKDDLVSISATKKFIAQFAAALITASFADVRLQSLHGLMGIYDLPVSISIAFSVVGCMFVTNAFNLIDGIDGLAGTIGVFISAVFGVGLAFEGRVSEAILAFSMMGAILGFLRFNISPARIFMGDTGSLLIGFMVSVIGILFINGHQTSSHLARFIPTDSGALVIALAILFVPVCDTFRVFGTRIAKGRSPFSADRTHLHHYLLDTGLTHTQTVAVILGGNIFIVAIAFFVQRYNINLAMACLLAVMLAFYAVIGFIKAKKKGLNRSRLSRFTFSYRRRSSNPEPELDGAVTHFTVEGKHILVGDEELASSEN